MLRGERCDASGFAAEETEGRCRDLPCITERPGHAQDWVLGSWRPQRLLKPRPGPQALVRRPRACWEPAARPPVCPFPGAWAWVVSCEPKPGAAWLLTPWWIRAAVPMATRVSLSLGKAIRWGLRASELRSMEPGLRGRSCCKQAVPPRGGVCRGGARASSHEETFPRGWRSSCDLFGREPCCLAALCRAGG